MKQLMYLMILAALVSSCKKRKEYSCYCITTAFYNFSQYSYKSTTTKMTEKMTEKQAKSVCAHEAVNINATYNNFFTGNGNFANNSGITQETVCSLQ